MAAPPELSPHYYRDNFFRLLDTVEAQYADLLAEAELDFIARLRNAHFDAQCLYVRLVSRTGPWFREARLDYPEIGDCGAALEQLLAAGLALEAQELALEEIDKLYPRPELARAFGLRSPRKTEQLAELAASEIDPESLCDALTRFDRARIVAPAHTDTVALLQLLFFGNRRQGLTDFVLSDLGVARYYPYELDRSRRLFPNRAAVEEYMAFAALSDAWHLARAEAAQPESAPIEVRLGISPVPGRPRAGMPRPASREVEPAMDGAFWRSRHRGNAEPDRDSEPLSPATRKLLPTPEMLARMLADTPAKFPTSRPRRDRLANTMARQLERDGELELALRLYRESETHPARERAARVLERLGEERAALQAAEAALDDPWCEEERDAMGRIATRLARRLGEARKPRKRDRFTTLELAFPRPELRVEQAAAEQLAGQWREVHYVENQLMCALFGLAFWEQIFAPLPGAFNNPFQAAPADMYEASFRHARKAQLEARFEQLAQVNLAAELAAAHRRYSDYQCRWINWRAIHPGLVETAAATIPAPHLLAIWRRMLFDPRENRRGFPDLLALGEGAGEYCMIEVKGPGDTLQESQKRWLRFFGEQGIPAAVAHVSWTDG